ncbi:hypothetical protein GZ77_09270 [Endozoicomonas montiporae]|uniref:Uncharacterized protein n=2 Tax=Endozoicomonas montiporae TaxID=1027273 RepID=A0A081N7U9_9GAMM|nr:hypothetical protein EZMO1_1435 [Endozoicomonas montiporae CL-33]KEQ14522.1 hypothetical protein GZ77_09270 [Endozoicomonas montiporae]
MDNNSAERLDTKSLSIYIESMEFLLKIAARELESEAKAHEDSKDMCRRPRANELRCICKQLLSPFASDRK